MKKYLPLVLFIILTSVVLGFLYFKLMVAPTLGPGTITPSLTPNPTMVIINQKIEEVKKEGGEIPFDYEVLSVTKLDAQVQGLKGKATILNNSRFHFFFKKEGKNTQAYFEDLKLGQKLIIERFPPPSKDLNVYILE